MIKHKGKDYVRVSQVLQPHTDFSHIPPSVLQNKADIGTRTHDAIHDFLLDKFPVLDEDTEPYFESFHRWYTRMTPLFVETEKRYFDDELMLTGCVDGVIELIPNKPTLIDFKTSVSESPTWIMQAHLYYYLALSRHLEHEFLFIKLAKNGTLPKVFTYKYNAKMLNKCLGHVREFWEKHKKDEMKVD